MASKSFTSGSTACSLNERFVKCNNCKVNIQKEEISGDDPQCPLCATSLDVNTTVVFEDTAKCTAAQKRKGQGEHRKKQWVELTLPSGAVYYHNRCTGVDQWEMPPDYYVADMQEEGFVIDPLGEDPIKKAVLSAEDKKLRAKYGIPEPTRSPEKPEAPAIEPATSSPETPTQLAQQETKSGDHECTVADRRRRGDSDSHNKETDAGMTRNRGGLFSCVVM